ncbi:hypothetical protein Tco_1305334, partial [Tanacetum coccineum]
WGTSKKGIIKCPSKLLSPKYQAQPSLGDEGRNSSSPKRVHFVNTITIIRKEDEPKETEPLKFDSDRYLDRNNENPVDKESKASEIVIDEEELSDHGINDDGCEVDKEEEWVEYEEPLDLVDMNEESVYESLIEKMPSCSLNFDFRIEKGDPSNLKIPCMIGRKFIANVYIDLDSPMNVMSLAGYNAIINQGYEFMGQNFIGIGKDMHVFRGNMCRVMDFTILENIEATIDPNLSQVVFGRPFLEITKLILDREQGHDLLSSRVILSEDDYSRGCERASDLESRFYKDIDKLGPSYDA